MTGRQGGKAPEPECESYKTPKRQSARAESVGATERHSAERRSGEASELQRRPSAERPGGSVRVRSAKAEERQSGGTSEQRMSGQQSARATIVRF